MEDTIAAIATPYGEGGIGIIRISGEKSLEISRGIFLPGKNRNLDCDFSDEYYNEDFIFVDRKLNYGHVIDNEYKIVDEVLCAYMKGPNTYTGEDVIEINCHGGMIPLKKILELILKKGARLAEPGEFTKRAFLNGRLDLTQAEAVMDIISSKAEKTYNVAIDQMEGNLSREISNIRNLIIDILVDLTVNIDYPDEDIEEVTYSKLISNLKIVKSKISNLLDTADTGKIIKEGLKVAIIGKPNVGKSSLMNGLLKESRAIVTDIPGTTRDTIEETLSIGGIPIILIDTAGIRETSDPIESIGIEKSKLSFDQADLVILVLDGSRYLSKEDKDIISYLKKKNTLVLINKSDLEQKIDINDVKGLLPNKDIINVSMKDFEGIYSVEKHIVNSVYLGNISQNESLLITNVRHKNLLEKSASFISDAIGISKMNEPLEIIEIDVNQAYKTLGEIIGAEYSDDILEEVFSRFCLGK